MSETPSTQGDNVLLRRPAIATVVLLTALLVPVAVVPYALARRRISRLSLQVDRLAAANADLQSATAKSAHDIGLRRDDLTRTAALLEKSRNDLSLLRRDISQTQAQLDSFRSATRTELRSLSEEGRRTRHHLRLCPRLGLSLADVAAFMHEVELHHSLPSSVTRNHSIEKLRVLALQLQATSESSARFMYGSGSEHVGITLLTKVPNKDMPPRESAAQTQLSERTKQDTAIKYLVCSGTHTSWTT